MPKSPTKPTRAKPPMRSIAERNALVEANVGLTHYIALKWVQRGEDYDDCLSVCHEAILRAASKFDTSRGFRFSTYACNVMSRAIGRMRKDRDEKGEPSHIRDDEHPSYQAVIERGIGKREVHRLIWCLSDADRELICRTFGIARELEPCAAVARDRNLSPSRVQQIRIDALDKLRGLLWRSQNP